MSKKIEPRSVVGESRAIAPAESPLGAMDLHLFNEGTHERLYEKLGAHPLTIGGRSGTHFAVWAPDAESVSVIGDFNGWDNIRHPLYPREQSVMARSTNITSPRVIAVTAKTRPILLPDSVKSRRAPRESCGTWSTIGMTPIG